MANRLLITGATGFIGQHLVRAAVDRGHVVRALVRPTSSRERVEPLRELGIEQVTGDLTDAASLRGVCDDVDAVIHTACALKGTFDADRDAERKFLDVNRDGTAHLAHEALEGGVRFVHTSSTAAMGTPPVSPTGVIHADETTPCYPKAPYQVSKRAAELALLDLHRKSGLDVVILRPCLVAGPGKDGGELLKLFRLVKKGRFPFIGRSVLAPQRPVTKPLLMVDDLVDALLAAIDRGRSGHGYLLHSGGGHTLEAIVETAGRLTGARRTHIPIPLSAARAVAQSLATLHVMAPGFNPPLTPERVELFVADRRIDIGKARRELGFEPKVQDLDALLGPTYDWYHAQGLV